MSDYLTRRMVEIAKRRDKTPDILLDDGRGAIIKMKQVLKELLEQKKQ